MLQHSRRREAVMLLSYNQLSYIMYGESILARGEVSLSCLI